MSSRHPAGLPYIVGNEAAERFSYYGMKCILVVFMTGYLTRSDGSPDPMTQPEALFWYHLFGTANYLFPLLGALVADTLLGKYRTIVYLSLVYCIGHAVLAVDSTRYGLLAGLLLIAVGSGGIKPCVSAHLGDQYSPDQSGLLTKAYGWFYLAINVGAFVSTLLVPYLLERHGPHVAFAVPGVLMALATVVFVSGKRRFVTLPPVPLRSYLIALREPAQRRRIGEAVLLFALLSVFWSLFDQTGSSWIVQAERLDRRITVPVFGSFELLPSQVQSLNPLLILLFVPLFSQVVYPAVGRLIALTPVRRIWMGVAVSAVSFVIVGVTQVALESGSSVSIGWQALAYAVLTAAEVMVSVTALEYAYVRSPTVSRSFVMSFYMLSIALGNLLTAVTSAALSRLYTGGEVVSGGYFFAYASLAAMSCGFIAYLFDWRDSHGNTQSPRRGPM